MKKSFVNAQNGGGGKNLKLLKGFTLAEVLITLGIIGIVAALTLPVLIAYHRKKVVENKLKSTYSIVYEAIGMAIVNNDIPEHWYVENPYGYEFFDRYFLPYLKIIKKCNGGILVNTGECRRIIFFQNGENRNAFSSGSKVILTNGVGIGVFAASYASDNNRRKAIIDIDLNPGNKGNMLAGRDFFSFNLEFDNSNPGWTLTSSQDYSTNIDVAWSPNCAQIQNNQSVRSKFINSCKAPDEYDGYNRGIYCTALIECNGWKIPDDYPIKL